MASSAENRRLADVAAKFFWNTSVDVLTRGLSPDTASKLVDALADAGKRVETDPVGAIERARAAFAAVDSEASPRDPTFQLPDDAWGRGTRVISTLKVTLNVEGNVDAEGDGIVRTAAWTSR